MKHWRIVKRNTFLEIWGVKAKYLLQKTGCSMHPHFQAYQLLLHCPVSHPPFTDMCQRPPGQYPPFHTAVTDGTLTIAPNTEQAGLSHARLHPNNGTTIDTVTPGDPA